MQILRNVSGEKLKPECLELQLTTLHNLSNVECVFRDRLVLFYVQEDKIMFELKFILPN